MYTNTFDAPNPAILQYIYIYIYICLPSGPWDLFQASWLLGPQKTRENRPRKLTLIRLKNTQQHVRFGSEPLWPRKRPKNENTQTHVCLHIAAFSEFLTPSENMQKTHEIRCRCTKYAETIVFECFLHFRLISLVFACFLKVLKPKPHKNA